MSILARELDAYQRAVEAYQRQMRGYNKGVESYNASILTDANGRPMVRDTNGTVYYVKEDGKLAYASLPNDKIAGDYGGTALEGDDRFLLMRQNPTQQKQQYLTGVIKNYDSETGQTTYYYYDPNAGSGGDGGSGQYVPVNQNLYRYVSEQPGGYDSENNPLPPTYTFGTDASTYLTKPGEFEGKIRMKRPDPTAAQLRKLSNPGLAAQERTGLISGEIIRGGGVLGGGLVRGSATVAPPPDDPDKPGDPTVDPNVDPKNPLQSIL